MKLVEMNWNPTDRQLRQFGAAACAALPVLAWFWSDYNLMAAAVAAVAGALIAGLGFIVPQTLKPVFVGLSLVTIPIGLVVSELVLLFLFYGVFVPVGLLMKMIGRDALDRSWSRDAQTYWQPKRQPSGPKSYFRQS